MAPTNSPSLVVRLNAVGRRAWWLTLGARTCQAVVLLASVWLVIVGLDAFLRISYPGWRWAVTLACCVASGLSLWIRFRAFEWSYPTPQRVARLIEQSLTPSNRPSIDSASDACSEANLPSHWLSSTISLQLDSRVRQHVSPELVAKAIEQGEIRSQSIDLDAFLHTGRLYRWGLSAALPVIVLGILAFNKPDLISIALQRLMIPWKDVHWPRQVELQWIDIPRQAAAGESIVVSIENRRGPLPPNLMLHLRESDQATELVRPMPQATTRFMSAATYIDVRVTGGDDQDMPWHRIDLLQPCQLLEWELEIMPPAYLHRSSYRTTGPFHIPAESRVRLWGKLSEPVRELALARQSMGPTSGVDTVNGFEMIGDSPTISIPMQLDRKSLIWPHSDEPALPMADSERWQLKWVSEAGLIGQSRPVWDIHVVPDLVPQIALSKPPQDLVMTPEATIALEGAATDDHGIAQIQLGWEILDRDRLVHSTGTVDVPISTNRSGLEPSPQGEPSRTWRASWNWTPSDDATRMPGGLIPGHSLQFWLVVRDHRGQIAESDRRSIRLSDPSAVVDDAIAEQRYLLQKLERSLDFERRAMKALGHLAEAIHSDTTTNLTGNYLSEMASHQARVRSELLADVDSARSHVAEQLSQLQANQLATHPIAQTLQSLAQWLERTERHTMLELDRYGSEWAERYHQSQWDAWRASFDSESESIQTAQRMIEEGLVHWIGELQSSSQQQTIQRELKSLIVSQRALADASRQLADAMLQSRLSKDQQQALLGNQERQNELARQMEEVQRNLRREENRLATDGAGADDERESRLKNLRERLERADIVADMRRAASLLQEQNIAQGSELQEELARRMETMVAESQATNAPEDRAEPGQEWMRLLELLLPQQMAIVDRWNALVEMPASEQIEEANRLSRDQDRVAKSLDDYLTLPRRANTLDWVAQTASDAMHKSTQATMRQQWTIAARSARLAVDRLRAIQQALQRSPTKPKTESNSSETPEGTNEPSSNTSSGLRMQELVLLRDIQDAIRGRAQQISQETNQGKLNAEQWIEVNELANQQKELLEALRTLLTTPE